MKNRLTREQEAKYIAERGVCCPFCSSGNLEGDSFEIDNGIAPQAITCTDCRKEWTDVYTLTGATTVYHSSESDFEKLAEACEGFKCQACGREEIACSADPCAAVIADREGRN